MHLIVPCHYIYHKRVAWDIIAEFEESFYPKNEQYGFESRLLSEKQHM